MTARLLAWTLLCAACGLAAAAGGAGARPARRAAPVYHLVAPTAAQCPKPAEILGNACVDPRGHGAADHWTILGSSARWDYAYGTTPGWTTTYAWTVPASVPASGALVQLTLSAQEKTNNPGARICPGIGVSGGFTVTSEAASIQICADSGKSASKTFTVKVAQPSGPFALLQVGVLDGPLVSYRYVASAAGVAQPEPIEGCDEPSGFRIPSAGHAINEVRLVAVHPDVRVHREGTPDECWIPADVGMLLKQGDEISCDPDGSATLAFADNSTVVVRNTTQLKMASFFNEGGVVRTEILLKMGDVAAKVNKSEATKSDFRIKSPTAGAGVRGTIFSVFYDPVSRVTITSVTRGSVEVDPVKPGLPTTTLTAGKEIEVTATAESPVAPIGMAGARGGVNRVKARKLVLALIAAKNGPCGIETPHGGAFGVKPWRQGGWLVSVRVTGKLRGWSSWQVTGTRVTPSNPLAKRIAVGCR